MHAPAVLCSAKDAAIRVTLIDASDEGARIQTEAEGKIDALCLYRLYVPNLLESECLCVWHQQSQAGLSFLQPLPPGVVDDLAQIFPALPENAAVSGPPSRTRFRAV